MIHSPPTLMSQNGRARLEIGGASIILAVCGTQDGKNKRDKRQETSKREGNRKGTRYSGVDHLLHEVDLGDLLAHQGACDSFAVRRPLQGSAGTHAERLGDNLRTDPTRGEVAARPRCLLSVDEQQESKKTMKTTTKRLRRQDHMNGGEKK